MNEESYKNIVIEAFENPFDKKNFAKFIRNLLKDVNESKIFTYNGSYILDSFKGYIKTYERIGQYCSEDGSILDVLIVTLKDLTTLERARSTQRNFVKWYLNGGRGKLRDAALVAFKVEDYPNWRFSFVRMKYSYDENGKVKDETTPAKRYSFLVGKDERSHTTQSRFWQLIEQTDLKPSLDEIEEAFNVESVTKEFFEKYRELFIKTVDQINKNLAENQLLREEFKRKDISSVDFAKKLLGQIVFLYFLQKKGWLGVEKNKTWGTGSKKFLRVLFEKSKDEDKNFFNDYLKYLFYDALNNERSHQADPSYHEYLGCRIPFLNGGLFEPYNDYDWKKIDLMIPDKLFSNQSEDGILDNFDLYNFTVKEDEPLEKEVAIDPELLGKIYEKFNAIRKDNFEEYEKAIKSRASESKFNKEYGVYYTPREIVHFMAKSSLVEYLFENLKDRFQDLENLKDDLENFIFYSDELRENEIKAIEKQEKIDRGEQRSTKYTAKMPAFIQENAKIIDDLLKDVKIIDPAVGSGAFPIGLMHEIVKARESLHSLYLERKKTAYELKRYCIENNLHGVDIDSGAIEITRLRFWLSLVVDEEDLTQIKPLPNLDYKLVVGDSLKNIERNLLKDFEYLENLIDRHYNETNFEEKKRLKQEIESEIDNLTEGKKEFDFSVYFSRVMRNGGFDIVIGNPPYVSTKGVNEEDKKFFKKLFGFSDDLYSHFYFKGMEILKYNGVLAYISSKTFWTIQTKKNLRELLLKNKLLELVDVGNPFENAMVDTCITIVQKTPANNYDISFIDARDGLESKKIYKVKDEVYKNVTNNVFFMPTEFNLKIYEKFGKHVKELIDKWWPKISTSKNIEKYTEELTLYRQSLKPGDITLLGLITDGGQGLATANNGKYVGVLEGTKYGKKVRQERPEKLWNFVKTKKPEELSFLKSEQDVVDYLNILSEKEIRQLFDDLKEKHGRDIFGQGWLYRIVSKDEIADVDSLSDDEKLNGIDGDKTYVPYDKGDKDGNRWWAPTPYYIDWSRENVKFLQTDPKARWQGYQFYFKEGFCWTFTLNEFSKYFKARIKEKSVFDVNAMTLLSIIDNVSEKYIVSLINSYFIFHLKRIFINSTSGFQINDARQFPIIIPTDEQLKEFEDIFNRAVNIQKQKFLGGITEDEVERRLEKIQEELDARVLKLYAL
jgi:hypothetical protein